MLEWYLSHTGIFGKRKQYFVGNWIRLWLGDLSVVCDKKPGKEHPPFAYFCYHIRVISEIVGKDAGRGMRFDFV